MVFTPAPRRSLLFIITLLIIPIILLLHVVYEPQSSLVSFVWSSKSRAELKNTELMGYGSFPARVDRLRALCDEEDPFEPEYGRANLRMSRAYEGQISMVLDHNP